MLYSQPHRDDPILFTIWSLDGFRGQAFNFAGAIASAAYPLANLALFVPFSVPIPCVVKEGVVQSGTLTAGNFDIGVYDEAGTRLTSSGSTAKGTASVPIQTTTMTDLSLVQNRTYYMAFSADGTNNYVAGSLVAGLYASMGILEATTAFVLPSTVTYAITTRAYMPYFGLNMQSTGF